MSSDDRFVSTILFRLLTRLEQQTLLLPLSDDIELLHQTRVSVRRIRAAFYLFDRQLNKRTQQCLSDIRTLAKALRQPRDLDVQMESLDKILSQKTRETKEKAALIELKQCLTAMRSSAQQTLLKALRRFDQKNTFSRLKKNLQALITDPKRPSVRRRWRLNWQQKTHGLIYPVAVDLEILAQMDPETLHKHRKNIRQLRYLLDMAHLYGQSPKLARCLKTIKRLQDHLGDTHDADVWLQSLPHYHQMIHPHPADHHRPLNRFFQAMQKTQSALRQQAFEQLLTTWEQLQKKGFWHELIKAASESFNQKNGTPPK